MRPPRSLRPERSVSRGLLAHGDIVGVNGSLPKRGLGSFWGLKWSNCKKTGCLHFQCSTRVSTMSAIRKSGLKVKFWTPVVNKRNGSLENHILGKQSGQMAWAQRALFFLRGHGMFFVEKKNHEIFQYCTVEIIKNHERCSVSRLACRTCRYSVGS